MPIWKGYILYDSNYMTFWKRQNYGNSKKFNNFQEFGDEWAEYRGFLEQSKSSVWYYNDGHMTFIYFFKPMECRTLRMNPNVNYGLMMCQSSIIICNKCTLWWGMLIMEEDMQ